MSDTDVKSAMDAIVNAGRAEFPDFDDRSVFAVTVAADAGELRQALAGIGSDAHRVIASLADDPDEAARILALRGTKLGSALGRYAATKANAPDPVSPAPKPKAVPDIYDPALPMKEWVSAWDARAKERREYQPKSIDITDPKISMRDFDFVRSQQERARREAKRFR